VHDLSVSLNHTFPNNGTNNEDNNGIIMATLNDPIVELPTSEGYNSIITVIDHNCTKAVILVPCKETIDAEGVAKLFKDRIFPFVGLPKCIISDRDPHFTSTFFKELCKQLEVRRT
jgi:hypothetical protein